MGAQVINIRWYAIFGQHNTFGDGAIPLPGFLDRNNTSHKPITVPLPRVGVVDLPLPNPTLNIALDVDRYLLDFAIQTQSPPYGSWGTNMPTQTTAAAYRAAIIAIRLLTNSHFHF